MEMLYEIFWSLFKTYLKSRILLNGVNGKYLSMKKIILRKIIWKSKQIQLN